MIKVCCSNGKPYDTFSDIEKLGCYSTDHCVGPIEVEEFDLLLTGLGTFDPEECISAEELGKLIFKRGEDKCDGCESVGTRIEMSVYDDWEGMLTCAVCGIKSKK